MPGYHKRFESGYKQALRALPSCLSQHWGDGLYEFLLEVDGSLLVTALSPLQSRSEYLHYYGAGGEKAPPTFPVTADATSEPDFVKHDVASFKKPPIIVGLTAHDSSLNSWSSLWRC